MSPSGKDVSSFIADLESPDPNVRYSALARFDRALLQSARVAQKVTALSSSDPDLRVRQMAAVFCPRDRLLSDSISPEGLRTSVPPGQLGSPRIVAGGPDPGFCPFCGRVTSAEWAFCRKCGNALRGEAASPHPTQARGTASNLPKRSVLTDDYTKSRHWYPRGRFGGLALLLSFGAGWYAIGTGDIGGFLVMIVAGVVALVLLGGRGIIWTLLVWAVVFAIALLGN